MLIYLHRAIEDIENWTVQVCLDLVSISRGLSDAGAGAGAGKGLHGPKIKMIRKRNSGIVVTDCNLKKISKSVCREFGKSESAR